MSKAHERIWLEPSGPFGGREWCEDKIWPDATEYVRADLATAPPSIDADMAMRLQRAKAALDAMDAPVTEAEVERARRVYARSPSHPSGIQSMLIDFLTTRIAERGSVPPAGAKPDPIGRLLNALRFWRENEAHEICIGALATDDSEESIGDLIDAALQAKRGQP